MSGLDQQGQAAYTPLTRALSPAALTQGRLPALLTACTLVAAAIAGARSCARGLGLKTAPPALALQDYIKWPPPFDAKKEDCGLIEDGVDYQGSDLVNMTTVEQLPNVGSAEMCCAACAGYPSCTAWTWGKKRGVQFLTDACFLKAVGQGQQPVKVSNDKVVSGFPSKRVRKQGVSPPPASKTGKMEGVSQKPVAAGAITGKCPGQLMVAGHGQVSLVNAKWNTPGVPAMKVEVLAGDAVVPHMGGRTYFGHACAEGSYDHTQYAAINLLGKTLKYTTDVSGTGCGCNAALYLTSLQQNPQIGKCEDYYCDAASVCGVPCAEIDLQEASQYAWFSTLHTFANASGPDGLGTARGYGGSLGEPPRRDWTSEEYGPGSRCIDTTMPFQVAISFPANAQGSLAAMEVSLSQQGKSCPLRARIDQYLLKGGRDGLAELNVAMKAGMTPIISYWSSKDMLWMDGLGADGRGPCVKDKPQACPDYVRFFGFSIEAIQASTA